MNEEIRFVAPYSYRTYTTVLVFTFSIFAVTAVAHSEGAIMYGIPFGLALAMYFVVPVFLVEADALSYRFGYISKKFSYADCVFHIEKRVGIESLINTYCPVSYVLRMEGVPQKRPIPVTLVENEFITMLKAMLERGARVEGLGLVPGGKELVPSAEKAAADSAEETIKDADRPAGSAEQTEPPAPADA